MQLRILTVLVLSAAFVRAADRPNILFAISDDQSWMHCGAYGDRATKTPAFDRVAKEGVLFTHAFTAAPSCAPARAAVLTGRPIWQLEEGGNLMGVLKAKFKLFHHLLEDSGYQIGTTGKTWGPGRFEKQKAGRPLFAKNYNKRKLESPRQGMSRIDYAANFDDFLAERDADKPFFFWYGSSEPHQKYEVGAWKAAGKQLKDARLPGCLPDDAVTRGEILDYGLEIEHFDTHLGRILAALETADELDNTLVVVTSDHGNPMPRSKCNLYDSGVRVPLSVRLPGKIPAGRKVDDFVSLIDLAPTFLATGNLEVPGEVVGKSLWPILSSEKSGVVDEERKFVVTAMERHTICRKEGVGYPMRALRTKEWLYVRNYEPDRWPAGDPDYLSPHQGFFGDIDRGESKRFMLELSEHPKVRPFYLRAFGRRPAEELYDIATDPEQLRNLLVAGHRVGRVDTDAVVDMWQWLEAYLRKHEDPRVLGESPWDEYEYTAKQAFKNPRWKSEGVETRLPK